MADYKRGVEGMKNERWTIHIKIGGHTIARGKRGVRGHIRDIKRGWHREMRRMNKRFICET